MSTYCSRPWNELHIEENGNVTPCCVMPSNRFFMGSSIKQYFFSQKLKTLKNQLMNNEKPKQCEYCWDAEANNIKSHRKTNERQGIKQIHIRLNNDCNFKCRMCNPKFSSTWEIENRKHNYFVHEYSTQKDVFDHDPHLLPFIVSLIKKQGTNYINLSGGEPLITDAHYKFLNYLIDNDATDITLGYSTNLSNLNYKKIDLMSLWSNFKGIDIIASCDGWGQAVEYSRTGFNRKIFLENMSKVHKYIQAVNCVVNIYSVWTLPYIEQICDKLRIKPVYAPCFLPEFLNPQHLDKADKDKLQKLYKPYTRLTKIFDDYISQDKPSLGKEMCEYNLMLDSYRDTNFFEVFPQYRKYYDSIS